MRVSLSTVFCLLLLLSPASSLAGNPLASTVELVAPKGASEAARRLVLSDQLSPAWQQARVDWLVVRSLGGQRSLPGKKLRQGQPIDFQLEEQGCVLVLADLVPAAIPASPARPSRSIKIVSCRFGKSAVDVLAARRQAAAVLTSKVGSRIELRPLFNPALLRVGSDLPVRAYFQGSSVSGARLVAQSEDGSKHLATTDSVGIAALALDRPGRWTLRFEHLNSAVAEPSVAELVFEVLDDAAWQRLSGEGR